MAGAGQRFQDAGYRTIKPLLSIEGKPMVVKVVEDLPAASRVVFVVNRDHVEQFEIDKILRAHLPEAEIVVAPGLTQGQACSVQLAVPKLDLEEDVLVAACDNTHLYDQQQLDELSRPASKVDCLIWTYRQEPRVLVNPHWYGWVKTHGNTHVTSVSVKQPISNNLLEDHVVSGAFWFRSARLLNAGIDQLIANNERVNNEFYLDSVPSLLIEQACDVRVFEVEKYIGWGTPDDYEAYQQWSQYVRRGIDRAAA